MIRALVTGASSGVGYAVARRYLEGGGSVGLLARRAEKLDALVEEFGDAAIALPTDVADPEAVAASVGRLVDELGAVDLAVNAAGVAMPVAIADVDLATWRENFDVNLAGTLYVATEVGRRMTQSGGGTIVNVGSELSFKGEALFATYCATKFAVLELTRRLAARFAPTVRCHVVCPGGIDTPMLDAELEVFPDPELARREAIEAVPLGRLASSGEIADAIDFLAFHVDGSGTALRVDGGTTI